jgi:hypothetical protein
VIYRHGCNKRHVPERSRSAPTGIQTSALENKGRYNSPLPSHKWFSTSSSSRTDRRVTAPVQTPTIPKPSNFVYLIREHHPFTGTFVINPSLHIPTSLLHQLGDGESEADRKNLKLFSTGNVDVEIRLTADVGNGRATMIDLTSENGYIEAKLVRLFLSPLWLTFLMYLNRASMCARM